MNPGRLAVKITSADGRVTRWGGLEPDAAAIPEGLSFQTGLPGGFKSLSCSLRRDDRESRGDLDRFDDVKVYGPGGEVAWEGRQAEFPRRTGDDYSVDVDAVGYAAHLLDDPSFREVYVDRDLTRWLGPTSARHAAFISGGGTSMDDPSVEGSPSDDLPALKLNMPGEAAAVNDRSAEAHYDAGPGHAIGDLYMDWTSTQTVGTIEFLAGVADDPEFSAYDQTADLYGSAGADYLSDRLTFSARRYAFLRTKNQVVFGAAQDHILWVRKVAVYGDHGLPLYGDEDPKGVYASDVIRDIVTRAAPLLDPAEISASSFVIPHLVFADMTTAEEAILTANGFDLNDWGVYDNRVFFWRDPASYRRRWIVRRDEGASFEDAGEVAETAVNGVIVQFTDASGEVKFAGPTGSGLDYEDGSLADTDPANVVNAHGIPRKWGRLDVKYTSNAAGAIRLGQKWLEGQSIAPQRGSVTAVGDVIDADSRARVPAWSVRAGDSIRVEDDDATERRIVETSYSHDDGVLSATLDNAPFRLDAMMERLGVVLVGVEG